MKVREIAFKDLGQQTKFDIGEYSEVERETWDEFVWSADNGTIFHTRRFLNYHPPQRFHDNSLILKKDRQWIAVLPAAVKHLGEEKSLISHPGASMAGLVIKSPQSIKDTFRLVDVLIEYAKEHAFTQIILTLPPQVYFSRPNHYLDFALLQLGFKYLKREVSSVIPLDFAEEDTLLKFSSASRRAVHKAESLGVEIAESDDLGRFCAILENNLKLRHNVKPTHSLEELQLLRTLFPDRIKLFAAYKQSRMIAGIVIFVCNEKVALAFYISHDEEMQEYRGVNMLFYEAIRWCIRQRFQFLDFGIFTVSMKPNWGLARFKESFGALGIFRDTFVKNLQILS